jgi:hypothetical protein
MLDKDVIELLGDSPEQIERNVLLLGDAPERIERRALDRKP